MKRVFINYRRDDASAEAMLVQKALVEAFGEEHVFMDVASVEPGARWPSAIRHRLRNATAVVVIIGPNWLRVGSDQWGRRRIDQPSDWVRQELETALHTAKKVIPLFVGGASPQIPRDALPSRIRKLTQHQGISIRREYWDHDLQLLVASLSQGPFKNARDGQSRSPFPGGNFLPPDKLSEPKLKAVLRQDLSLWEHVRSPLPEDPTITREELFRELRFKSFAAAITFMNQVAPGCDIANHHPRWENIYKVVRVYLSTWDGGLHAVSDRDVQLARYFDRAYGDFPDKPGPQKQVNTRRQTRSKPYH